MLVNLQLFYRKDIIFPFNPLIGEVRVGIGRKNDSIPNFSVPWSGGKSGCFNPYGEERFLTWSESSIKLLLPHLSPLVGVQDNLNETKFLNRTSKVHKNKCLLYPFLPCLKKKKWELQFGKGILSILHVDTKGLIPFHTLGIMLLTWSLIG